MTLRQLRSSWLPAVGLWGPRSRFCGDRLEVYLMLRRESLTRGLYPDSSPAPSLGERAAAGGVDAGVVSGELAAAPASQPVKTAEELTVDA